MNAIDMKQVEEIVAASQTAVGDFLVTFLPDGCMVTEELDVMVIDLEDTEGWDG